MHERVEEFLGGQVIEAVTQPLGFSPAAAVRVRTAGGRRAFVKAVPPDLNPDTPGIYRREIEVCRSLPEGLPAPKLLWWLDEGADGWVVLLFDDLAGRPPALPWTPDDLALAVAAVDDLARRLTPSPLTTAPIGSWMAEEWPGWRSWLEDAPADLDPWARGRVPLLAELQRSAAELARGESLVHGDIRSDNLVIADSRCWATDWAWPRQGATWVDAVLFAFSVEVEGGPSAEAVLAMTEAGREAPADGIAAVAAAFTGMLSVRSRRPAPPGLPAIRPFQAAYAQAGLTWLKRLL